MNRILGGLEDGKIVLITGLRGVGKTTLLKSVAGRLEKGKGGVAFLDLEDPRFSPRPQKETLELFTRADPGGRRSSRSHIILDEVGRVDGWLDWAKKIKERFGLGIVASRSGPKVGLEGEDVVELTLYPRRLTDTSVKLDRYLRTGGLPVTGSAPDPRQALVELFNQCLFKDILQRSEVRDIDKLTAIAVYLVASSSRQVSATRLRGLLSRSVDQARGFLSHIEQSGLVYLVSRLEDGNRTRAQAARRCFSADCGLSVALSSREVDLRDLAETAVFHELLRRDLTVRAWRAKERLGLAVVDDSGPRLMVDVAYRDKTPVSSKSLASAMKAHGCRLGLLLADEVGEVNVPSGTIFKSSFAKWLQVPDLPGIAAPPDAKRQDEPEETQPLPAYLL